jgi:endogenous inhibitor of DNA gyrase (YacG/DUF329 family)
MERPCPICGRPAVQDRANPDRPFCSERCRMLDLARWLDGDYAVPGEPVDLPDGELRATEPSRPPGPEES